MSPFADWESFYVIIGSSAAALTGLQFVVIVLGSEKRLGGADATRAFGTPTVVHFCAVLLVSAVLSAPWHGVFGAALVLAVSGLVGFGYIARVVSHTRHQTSYQPVLEDWLWHAVLPAIAYAALMSASIRLLVKPIDLVTPLFTIGFAALLLLFSGIHNAWDAVTYIAYSEGKSSKSA